MFNTSLKYKVLRIIRNTRINSLEKGSANFLSDQAATDVNSSNSILGENYLIYYFYLIPSICI